MYLKRGQLYVPNYDQVHDVLCPAPFLHIPSGFNNERLLFALPQNFRPTFHNQPAMIDSHVRTAMFLRREIRIFGDRIIAWECVETGVRE